MPSLEKKQKKPTENDDYAVNNWNETSDLSASI